VRKDTVCVGLFCKRDLGIWVAYKSLSLYGRNCRGNCSREIHVCVSVFLCACNVYVLSEEFAGKVTSLSARTKCECTLWHFIPGNFELLRILILHSNTDRHTRAHAQKRTPTRIPTERQPQANTQTQTQT